MSEETEPLDDEVTDEELDSFIQGLAPESPGWTSTTVVYHGKDTRSILLSGPVDQELADGICSQLYLLDRESKEPIMMHINTPGGSITDGLAIYDTIKCIRSPVIGIVSGACYSAGLIILAATDLRLATPSASFFYHQPIMNPQELNSTETVQHTVEMYRWSQKHMDKIIRKRANISKKKWKQEFEGRVAKHFACKEALKYNIIDEVMAYSKKPEIVLSGDEEWLDEDEALD